MSIFIAPTKNQYNWKQVALSLFWIMLAPFVSQWMVLIPLFIQVYRLIHYDDHVFMADIALLINFTTIFKIPNFGAVIALLVVFSAIYHLCSVRYVENDVSFSLLLYLLAYLFLRIGGGYSKFIFVSCNIFIMYLMIHNCTPEDSVRIARNFILGLLIASVYGYLFRGSRALTHLIPKDGLASRNFINAYRFRAIFLDSNYYSCSLILAMSLTVVLHLVKKLTQPQAMIILFLFSFFGVATYSRTFFVMFVGLLLILVYLLFKNRHYFPFFCLCVAMITISLLIWTGKIHAFDVVLSRIFSSKNISDLTSGRSMQFKRYLNYIISTPKQFLFGSGIGANLYGKLGAHNLYLETLYFIGTFGALLLFSYFQSLRITLKRKNHIRYPFRHYLIAVLPLVMLMGVYCSLQGLLSTMLYVQFFVAFTAYLLPSFLIRKQPS